jgi:hypothetical protein
MVYVTEIRKVQMVYVTKKYCYTVYFKTLRKAQMVYVTEIYFYVFQNLENVRMVSVTAKCFEWFTTS